MASSKKDTGVSKTTVFERGKILEMNRYKDRVDLLSVLLEDERAYTHEEVTALINEFMKGKVN